MENKICKSCGIEFEITPDDQAFYEKMQVPPPTWCPECRFKRRNVWRTERKLYKRGCDLCKKSFIFMYPEGTKFPVYCRDCWLSDNWDPKSYGREYDFNKSFFHQWKELFDSVPRVGIIKQGQSVNSEYTNRITDARNCYLVYATTGVENSRYGAYLNNSKECLDCHTTFNSEQCSECIDCDRCYNVHYSQESQECRDSKFLFQCRNLSDCFGCVNMRNGRYLMFNEQLTKEEYEKRISEISFEEAKQKMKELKDKSIVPSMVTIRSINSTGNWIESSKNTSLCFNVREVEDMKYCVNVFNAKDCMDYTQWGNGSELIYESVSCGIQSGNCKFVNESWSQLMDSEYCTNCHQSSNLFGCNGIRNGQYCILNKQYSKDEYISLISKIKDQMLRMPYTDSKGREYGYGEFFPEELSPFSYNESTAQELMPLTKEKALKTGHIWRDQEVRNIEVKDGILVCEHKEKCEQLCTGAFRILPEDEEFYKRYNLESPKLCPNCRHFERISKRTPIKLWDRKCMKCSKDIQTSYSPDRPEIVYCVECYQQEVV